MKAPAVLLISLGLVLVACSDDPEPGRRAARTPTPAPAPESACPNEEAVVADASLRTGSPASGDVDGDGDAESVSVYLDPQGEPGCEAFVVAESSDATIAGALDRWREDYGLPMPTLNALQDVDGEPGVEVIVNLGAGASTQFVGIVVEDGGVMKQVTARVGPDAGVVADGLFGFGGSVGHLEAVDCAGGDTIVSSFAAPEGDVYRVERTFFAFDGAELVRVDERVERMPIERIDRLPEYALSPFGGC